MIESTTTINLNINAAREKLRLASLLSPKAHMMSVISPTTGISIRNKDQSHLPVDIAVLLMLSRTIAAVYALFGP